MGQGEGRGKLRESKDLVSENPQHPRDLNNFEDRQGFAGSGDPRIPSRTVVSTGSPIRRRERGREGRGGEGRKKSVRSVTIASV